MPSVESRSRASRRLVLPAASILLLSGLVATTVLVAPQSASAYPSWSEVQAAKGNAAATKTQVQQITSALDGLEKTAAASSDAAVKADASNSEAQSKLQAATTQADALAAQVTAEKKKAALAHQEAGQLAAHLYRIGNSTSLDGQLFSGRDASGTLYKLGALSQLTTQWQTVLDEATVASKSVSSLSAQAGVAAKERDRLATKAATTLAAAKSAQQRADAEVSSATTHQQTLYAQLASLNNTSATLEAQYRQGEAAKAAYEAQVARAKAAHAAQVLADQRAHAQQSQPSTPATTPSQGSTGTPSGGSLGSGAVDDPAGAQAYARSVLGNYGWASSQMSCLVLLWNQESGWRTSALNPSSLAYGIPQALPANKMSSAGFDWQTNYRTQISWGLGYIKAVYSSPCGAWAHEVAHNWY
ncbi:hypothetical protein GCM10025867_23840 [Frondihabitans sucicola]|uniref:Lytic transglycosylase domain-containing protein n=1 Tax=Frondihabitans sucicola TaxID=1268041 RepID=A0ABN6XYX0_9MICO|nr:hypothetical protein [Frondihabitans sucicola]BDZ50143.1 hypothetical protein GCM10025867_23840 [Frondihabitans sucicola]